MKKVILLIIGIVVLAVAIMFVMGLISLQRPPTNNQITDNNNYSGPRTELVNSLRARDIEYAGVRADGTLAVIDKFDKEIILSLRDFKWKNLTWSPDGNILALLGDVDNKQIFDLFTYDVARKELIRQTTFTNVGSGISGMAWSGDKVVFTQGENGENWFHQFDVSNKEVRKIFQIAGTLVDTDVNNKRLTFAGGQDAFAITDLEGKVIKWFVTGEVASGAKISRIVPIQDPFKFLLTTSSGYFTWDVSTTQFTKLNFVDRQKLIADVDGSAYSKETLGMQLLCEYAPGLLYSLGTDSAGKISLTTANYQLQFYTDVQVLPDIRAGEVTATNECLGGKTLIAHTLNGTTKWYVWEGKDFTEIAPTRNYPQLVIR